MEMSLTSEQQPKVVRNKLFEDTVEETWEEEKDQRKWSRNERGNGFRKLIRISELVRDENGDKNDEVSSGEETARIMQAEKIWAETNVDQEVARIMQVGKAWAETVVDSKGECADIDDGKMEFIDEVETSEIMIAESLDNDD